ncbi:MAG: THUMP domain-containing protein [Candidatus Nezhaarchaeota archaeon]|nr:THUMP domain-containing protein [Candidatus Nezhaarchaeota archaeon]
MPFLVLVTTKPGKEDAIEVEIADCLYRLDPSVKVERTEFRGVLKVYTNAPSKIAAKTIRRCWIGHVSRVVPVDEVVKSPDLKAVIEAVVKLAKDIKGSVAVRFIKRGGKLGSVSQVEAEVGAVLKQRLGLSINLEDPDFEVRIEELKDEALLSILSREDRRGQERTWPPWPLQSAV